MDNNTLFNEDDDKKEKKKREKDTEDELDLEDEEDILPIKETGGGGRKILWTIVVLIIIGLGIYSFAKREQIREGLETPEEKTKEEGEIGEGAEESLEEFTWKDTEEVEEEPTVEEGEQITIKESELPELEELEEEGKEVALEEKEEAQVTEEETKPEISIEEDKFVVTTGQGEGITHLARRALASYLEKSGREGELTNEHKIYIEDYLQNRTGSEWLSVNDQRTFTVGMIEEAVNAAEKLDEGQLKNLEKYAQVVYGSSGS